MAAESGENVNCKGSYDYVSSRDDPYRFTRFRKLIEMDSRYSDRELVKSLNYPHDRDVLSEAGWKYACKTIKKQESLLINILAPI